LEGETSLNKDEDEEEDQENSRISKVLNSSVDTEE
jgi:hypothetical protein